MDQVDGPVSSVYLQDHQLARLAANDNKTACHSFVHLHDPRDIILTSLKIDLAECLIPILATTIDAW